MSEAQSIYWTNCRVKLGDLKPWERNPKTISKAHARRLLANHKDFGQWQDVAIGPENEVYDGHQRLNVWLAAYGPNFEIDAKRASRALTEQERERFVIEAHVGTVGSLNYDALANWNPPRLKEAGFDADLLKEFKTGAAALGNFLSSEGEGDEQYSRKVEAPIYTPKGPKPETQELYDTKRADELLAEIEAADLPEAEKEFLRIAARRHTVLNFKRIAEYYAHSPAPVQRLMENSALVIIDFNRAIELGYVKLSKEIAAQYAKDYPDAG